MLNRLKWCLQQYPGDSFPGENKNQDIWKVHVIDYKHSLNFYMAHCMLIGTGSPSGTLISFGRPSIVRTVLGSIKRLIYRCNLESIQRRYGLSVQEKVIEICNSMDEHGLEDWRLVS